MQPVWLTISGVAIALLLIGQGCPTTDSGKKEADVKSKPALEEKKEGEVMEKKEGETIEKKEGEVMEKKEGETMEKKSEAMMNADLKLSAEALGSGAVKLTWTAPAGLNESNRFIIVRDELENPEHTGNNLWIRQSHLKREVVWDMVPTGAQHFSICLTKDDMKDVCREYSNDVLVEVK